MNDPTKATCAACGGDQYLRYSMWHGDDPICKPCFLIWYDCPIDLDVTDPEAVGAESRRRKEAGEWPWNDERFT